jgi:hypothetical protein
MGEPATKKREGRRMAKMSRRRRVSEKNVLQGGERVGDCGDEDWDEPGGVFED